MESHHARRAVYTSRGPQQGRYFTADSSKYRRNHFPRGGGEASITHVPSARFRSNLISIHQPLFPPTLRKILDFPITTSDSTALFARPGYHGTECPEWGRYPSNSKRSRRRAPRSREIESKAFTTVGDVARPTRGRRPFRPPAGIDLPQGARSLCRQPAETLLHLRRPICARRNPLL